MAGFTVAKNDLQFMPRKELFILIDSSGDDANPWTWAEDATNLIGSADADTYDLEGKVTASDLLDESLFTFS